MRINSGYALANCDFNVYARPTVPCPLVHDLLTNIADSIVVCTGTKAGNGNIVYRAAHGALKFVYATLPRLIRHHAPTANACKTEYCAMSLLIRGGTCG